MEESVDRQNNLLVDRARASGSLLIHGDEIVIVGRKGSENLERIPAD